MQLPSEYVTAYELYKIETRMKGNKKVWYLTGCKRLVEREDARVLAKAWKAETGCDPSVGVTAIHQDKLTQWLKDEVNVVKKPKRIKPSKEYLEHFSK